MPVKSAVLFPWCTAVRRPDRLRCLFHADVTEQQTDMENVAILFSGGMFQLGNRNNVHTHRHKESLERLKTADSLSTPLQLYKNTQRLRRLYLQYEQGDKQRVTGNKGNEK